jgi:hypothetical protein
MFKIIHDTYSNEIIEVPLTNAEIAQLKKDAAAFEKQIEKENAQQELKSAQRQAILDRLGLTADEAKLLLG